MPVIISLMLFWLSLLYSNLFISSDFLHFMKPKTQTMFNNEPMIKMVKMALFQNRRTTPKARRFNIEKIEISEVELKNFCTRS